MPANALSIASAAKARRVAMNADAVVARQAAIQAGQQRAYAAAQHSRLTLDWYTSLLSADQELKGDIRRLRGAARAAVRDTSLGSRYVNLIDENVVGDAGITMQAKLRTPPKNPVTKRGTLNKKLNGQIEDAWADWCQAENCSADGRLNWIGMQSLTARTLPQDGEYLIRLLRGYDNPHLFALQPLDVDLLDDEMTMTAERAPFGNEIRMGVEVNQYGRPVAYWMWTRHPADIGASGKREHVRVMADEILHDFITLRPGQSRGVTWFAPVLVNQQMLSAYIEAEITAARVGASNMAAIQYDPEKAGGGLAQAAPGASNIPREVEPGLFMRLGPGESLLSTDFGHPSGAFGPFLKFSSRALSSGLNVAYSSLSGDLEAVNFSSIRAGIIAERDFYRKLQGWFVERLCRRVFRAWLPMAVMAGKLPSDALALLDQPRAIQWRPRGWPWVDPESDARAASERISMGLETRTNILAQTSGADFEETLEQLAEEERLAKEAGIALGKDPSVQEAVTTVDNPALGGGKKPAPPTDDEPTNDEEEDDEDAKDAAERGVTLIRRHGT